MLGERLAWRVQVKVNGYLWSMKDGWRYILSSAFKIHVAELITGPCIEDAIRQIRQTSWVNRMLACTSPGGNSVLKNPQSWGASFFLVLTEVKEPTTRHDWWLTTWTRRIMSRRGHQDRNRKWSNKDKDFSAVWLRPCNDLGLYFTKSGQTVSAAPSLSLMVRWFCELPKPQDLCNNETGVAFSTVILLWVDHKYWSHSWRHAPPLVSRRGK